MSGTLIVMVVMGGLYFGWMAIEVLLWKLFQSGQPTPIPKKEIGPGPPALDLDDFEKHLRRHDDRERHLRRRHDNFEKHLRRHRER